MSRSIQLDIPNFGAPTDNVLTGGRPRIEDLQSASAQGVRKIVNLCPHAEDPGYDEPAVVAQLGMAYENIPVAGGGDLTRENAEKLARSLQGVDGPVLVHCASGNRVGALFALKSHHLDGKPVEDALADGRAHGLKAMEPAVRALLGG